MSQFAISNTKLRNKFSRLYNAKQSTARQFAISVPGHVSSKAKQSRS